MWMEARVSGSADEPWKRVRWPFRRRKVSGSTTAAYAITALLTKARPGGDEFPFQPHVCSCPSGRQQGVADGDPLRPGWEAPLSPAPGKTPQGAFPARALSLLIAAGIQAAKASFASQPSRPALAPGLGPVRLRLGQERTGLASVLPLAPGAGRALRNAAGAARVGHARVGAPRARGRCYGGSQRPPDGPNGPEVPNGPKWPQSPPRNGPRSPKCPQMS